MLSIDFGWKKNFFWPNRLWPCFKAFPAFFEKKFFWPNFGIFWHKIGIIMPYKGKVGSKMPFLAFLEAKKAKKSGRPGRESNPRPQPKRPKYAKIMPDYE